MMRSTPWKPWRRRHGSHANQQDGGVDGLITSSKCIEENLSDIDVRLLKDGANLPFQCIENFKYHDHSADVRVSASGSLAECLTGLGVGVHNYMSSIKKIRQADTRYIISRHTDTLQELIYDFVNRVFELYGDDYFMVSAIKILKLEKVNQVFDVLAVCAGETFDHNRHEQGTEVKAITKHDIIVQSINEVKDDPISSTYDICILVDI